MEFHTIEQRIGHVECSHGLSEGSFLAACIDATAKLKNDDPSKILTDLHCHISTQLKLESAEIFHVLPSRVKPTLPLLFSEKSPAESEIMNTDIEYELLSRSVRAFESEWIRTTLMQVFDGFAKAKAKVVGRTKNEIRIRHISLYYVLGVLNCLETLNIRFVSSSPIPYSSVPNADDAIQEAMLQELLVGMSIRATGLPDNAIQPTPLAVALLRVLSQPTKPTNSSMILELSGLGMGSTTPAIVFLVGRAETIPGASESPKPIPSELWLFDKLTHFQSNLDDATGEMLAYVVELLLKNGAADAWITPIVMKKGRPAHTLHCLCRSDCAQEAKLLELIFRHTTTLGIRIYRDLPRAKLCRSIVSAHTPHEETTRKGQVDVKLSSFQTGEIISMKPEFDHCREISIETGIPIKAIRDSAQAEVREQFEFKNAPPGNIP